VRAITPSTNQYNILLPSYCPQSSNIERQSEREVLCTRPHTISSPPIGTNVKEREGCILFLPEYITRQNCLPEFEREFCTEAKPWILLFDLGGFFGRVFVDIFIRNEP
jgi:hypothetical protein